MKTFKRLRQEALFTQTGLAAECDVSKQTIWNWEHGYSRPGPENMKRLIILLGKEVSEILDALDATAAEEAAKKVAAA